MTPPTTLGWDLSVSCVVLPYEVYCEIRGEEVDPELRGRLVQIQGGEARLMEEP
jgi:hypothetical protein